MSSYNVEMPSLGMAMDEGQVTTYFVAVGDRVREGDILFEIEAEKVTAEVESPATGVVDEVLIDSGIDVPVGTILLRIVANDGDRE